MPRLTGYMMRFDEWTEINSIFEGNFMERVKHGAAARTLKQNGQMRVLFNHGHDPTVGEKPIALPEFIEDSRGVRYDDPVLFDADYVRELVPGLRAGQYGSSFKFRSVAESIKDEPDASEANPKALPERTITELKLYEGGPVTFPAYEGSSAGARSLTDHFFLEALRADTAHAAELDEFFASWARANPAHVRSLLVAIDDDGGPWAQLAELIARSTANGQDDDSKSDDAPAGPEDTEPHSATAREDDPTTPQLYGVPSNSQRPAWLLNV